MKMDKTLKTKWIRALKSGKYKKGKNALRNEEGRFCCLGVLCKVANIKIEKDQSFIDGTSSKKLRLPLHQQEYLAQLNDGDSWTKDPPKGFSYYRGAPFPVIADWIKENL